MKRVRQKDIIAALAGTYALVNNTLTQNGVPIVSDGWGEKPAGLITYTPQGYMSANIAASQPEWRPLGIEWPPKETDSDADWLLVGKHALSYAGPFSINMTTDPPPTKQKGVVLHGPLHVASVPSMGGAVQRREYEVREGEGGEVYLFVYVRVPSSGLISEICWKRVAKS